MTRHIALAGLLTATLACAQGNGGPMLEARAGRVRDANDGRPIARADVFQVYWKRGRVGEPPTANALRWTEANAEGRFRFGEARRDEAGGHASAGNALEYGFYHPDYGLVRSGPPPTAGAAELELTAPSLDPAGREASVLQLCGSRPADAVHAGVALRHCDRPERDR